MPKKRQSSQQCHLALLGPASVKPARKTLVKLTPGRVRAARKMLVKSTTGGRDKRRNAGETGHAKRIFKVGTSGLYLRLIHAKNVLVLSDPFQI